MNPPAKEGGLLAALKSVKHIEWIVVLLLVGAVLLIASNMLPTAEKEKEPEAPPSLSASAEPLEARMEATLSLIDGAGDVRVLVNRAEGSDAIVGVIVVADGADSLAVRLELSRAVQSLLGVPQSNIEIFAMAKESEEET